MHSNAIGRRLEAIQARSAMRASEVANLLNVRPEIVAMWCSGTVSAHAEVERRVLDLDFIVDKLSDLYEPPDIRQWLFSRQRLLGDTTPAEMLQAGQAEEVLATVNQMLDGVSL